MRTYLALFRGPTIDDATLVAVTANRDLVRRFAGEMIRRGDDPASHPGSDPEDPVAAAVADGRRRALRLVADES